MLQEETAGPDRALYISTLIGGRTADNFQAIAAVQRLHQLVHQFPYPVRPSELQIDLIFQIPGDKLVPDFQGVRTGRLARRERILSVQVAVSLPFPASHVDYFMQVLSDVEHAVSAYAIQRKLALTTTDAIDALRDSASRLGSL